MAGCRAVSPPLFSPKSPANIRPLLFPFPLFFFFLLLFLSLPAAGAEGRCRVCLALAGVFFDAEGGGRSAAIGGGGSDAVRAGRRQRLVVAVHETVDGLCDRLRRLHRDDDAPKAVRISQEEIAARGGKGIRLDDDIFASGRAEQRMIDAACDRVLEEINEPLAQEAFDALLPAKDAEKKKPAAVGRRNHPLGRSGDFCERQNLCTPQHVEILLRERSEARERAGGVEESPRRAEGAGRGIVACVFFALAALLLLLLRRRRRGDKTTKSD